MSKNSKLTEVFLNYSTALKRSLSRFLNHEDIEDIVQETFVKSYEADLKQEIQYARSYMLKTAKHLALNHLQKWDNKHAESIEDFAHPLVELSSQSAEAEFESKERFLQFCQATDQLSGAVRRTFILKKVYGLSQKEIASYLEISESTVEKHVAKGLLECSLYMQRIDAADADAESQRSSQPLFKGKQRNAK